MSYARYYPETGQSVSAAGQSAPAVAAAGRTGADARGAGRAGAGIDGEALGQVLAGLQGGMDVRGFRSGMEAGQREPGNRALMHWVAARQSGGREAVAPLQLMGKKGKAPAAEAGAGSPGATQGPGCARATSVKKKKVRKKSLVAAALRTLRYEGVEAFGRYVAAELRDAASLLTLAQRIKSERDLVRVRAGALAFVEGTSSGATGGSGPAAGAGVAQAGAPAPGGRQPDIAVIAPVKSALTEGERYMFEACATNNAGWFGAVLRKGNVDVNVANEFGTFLCHCAYGGCANVARELLSVPSVNVNLAGYQGAAPLHLAVRERHVQVLTLLLAQRGIDVNLATAAGVTPLHIAAEKGCEEVVGLLLAAPGMNANMQRPDGVTALHLACAAGNTAIVRMLLHAGADPDDGVVDSVGVAHTLESLARTRGHGEVLSLLQAHRRRRGEASPRLEQVPVTEAPDAAGQATARVSPVPPPQFRTGAAATGTGPLTFFSPWSPPAGTAPATEPPTALEQAREAVRLELLGRPLSGCIDQQEGMQLLEDVKDAADLDRLCTLYDELAQLERAQRRRLAAAAPEYSLGEKTGLDAEAVENEIKGYLDRACHRFVGQVVNGMEFGRGKPTADYPGLLHVSAGVPGMGSCKVFYYLDGSGERTRIRIAGIGHLAGSATYRLDYAIAELGGAGRELRLE